MKHNENSRVKIPALIHLTRIGYKYLSLKDYQLEKMICTQKLHMPISELIDLCKTTQDHVILKYAKKIFGFAYSKTHNSYDAEDLSHEYSAPN